MFGCWCGRGKGKKRNKRKEKHSLNAKRREKNFPYFMYSQCVSTWNETFQIGKSGKSSGGWLINNRWAENTKSTFFQKKKGVEKRM